MTIRLKTAFFIILGFLGLWFLYLDRAILTPFILAGIFAYLFNPIVNFFSQKIRLPRTIVILIIYFMLIFGVIFLSIFVTKRIIDESSEFKNYITFLLEATKEQVNTLPDFIRPAVFENISALEKSKIFSAEFIFLLFPKAISRVVSFFIFLFSGFYFLKEGRNMIDKFLLFVPKNNRIEVEIVIRKINAAFGAYLRGQLFLVFFVSAILYLALSILGVKFAFILAIFSGFAEIVPIIGPITAGAIASLVVLITGNANFGLLPLQAAILVALVYTFLRQFQDYFVTPYIMGKVAKLHPLIILFAVLSGGHLFGILGLILAVPLAATVKILLEFFSDKVIIEDKKIPGRE